MASGVLYVYVDRVRGVDGARKIYARVATATGRTPAATTASAKPSAASSSVVDLCAPRVALTTTEDDEEAIVSVFNSPRIGPDVLIGSARVSLWGVITERSASAIVPLMAPGGNGVVVGDVAVRLAFEPTFVQRQQQPVQYEYQAPQPQQPQQPQYWQQQPQQQQQQQQVWGMPAAAQMAPNRAAAAPMMQQPQQQYQMPPPAPAGYPTSGGQLPMMPVVYGNSNGVAPVAARPGGGGSNMAGIGVGLAAGLGAGLLLDALF